MHTFLLTLLILVSNSLHFKVNLDLSRLYVIQISDSFTRIEYPGASSVSLVGAPEVPAISLNYVLPCGAKATNVDIVSMDTVSLDLKRPLIPMQGDIPLTSKEEHRFVLPDRAYYGKDKYTPGIVELAGTGDMAGYSIASLVFNPVIYYPKDTMAVIVKSIEFKIDYDFGTKQSVTITQKQKEIFGSILKKVVKNPEMVEKFSPLVKDVKDEVDMVIITEDSLIPYFEPLRRWKEERGLKCEIVSLENIYEQYLGRDRQEKIRTFLKDYYARRGLIYVLLGGASWHRNGKEVVPVRKAYYMDLGYNRIYDTIPCDLYYSDLDGSWDFNKNNVFGEIGDSVDMYPDVVVGRFPVITGEQVINLVGKVIKYEQSPVSHYINNCVLPAECLFPYWGYWGDTVSNAIADITPEPQIKDIKLYQSLGRLTRESFINAINEGGGFFAYALHGQPYGTRYLTLDDIPSLDENEKYGIHTGISCLLGASDMANEEFCFAEALVNKSNGGAVTDIMNTRFGFCAYGRMGPSEQLMKSFFEHVFLDSINTLGVAHVASLADWVPLAQTNTTMHRYCIYEYTIFGDPSLNMWTLDPEEFNVFHPSSIGTSERIIPLSVEIAEASAVLSFNGRMIDRKVVNGTDFLSIPDSVNLNAGDSLKIVVFASNKRPYIVTISVCEQDSYNLYPYIVEFLNSNQSSEIKPGDRIYVKFGLRNIGTQLARNVYCKIQTEDSSLTVLSDSCFIADSLSPEDSIIIDSAFVLKVAEDIPDNSYSGINMHIVSGSKVFQKTVNLKVVKSQLEITGYSLADTLSGDNNDGFLNENEEAVLFLSLTNRGHAGAHNITIKFFTDFPYLEIHDTLVSVDSIPSLGIMDSVHTIVRLDSILEDQLYANLFVILISPFDTVEDTILLFFNGGEYYTSMEDSMENLLVKSGDWHLTTSDYYSPPASMWCGDEATGEYTDGANSYLYLPMFVNPDKHAMIKFYSKYSVVYAQDSVVIEATKDGKNWVVLWESNYSISEWVPFSMPVSLGRPGDTIQVRLKLLSAGPLSARGWFVDDLSLGPAVFVPDLMVDSIILMDESRPNGRVDENEVVSFRLRLRKTGLKNVYNLVGKIRCLEGNVELRDSVVHYGNIVSLKSNETECFKIRTGMATEHKVLKFRLYLNADNYKDSLDFEMVLGAYVGPDSYGYYGYSSSSPYLYAPEFKWIEIGKDFRYSQQLMEDGAGLDTVYLPFEFRFYGKSYKKVTVSKNGWIGFGDYEDECIHNVGLPDTGAPHSIIAGLWDYMNPNLLGSGKIYYYVDKLNHQVIFEWDSVYHQIGAPSKFEIILHDPDYYPTPTRDGEVIIQYFSNPGNTDFTVGIQNQDGTQGLMYYHDGDYSPGAFDISRQFTIKFTTNPPFERPAPLPDKLAFEGPYPNIANDIISFKIAIPEKEQVSLILYDITGRKVKTVFNKRFSPGFYVWHFDIKQSKLSGGMYFAVLTTESEQLIRKFIVVR